MANAHISIHALRVEGDSHYDCPAHQFFQISIHALRVEGDKSGAGWISLDYVFLSTPSVWRATHPLGGKGLDVGISIHALRVEGDEQQMLLCVIP